MVRKPVLRSLSRGTIEDHQPIIHGGGVEKHDVSVSRLQPHALHGGVGEGGGTGKVDQPQRLRKVSGAPASQGKFLMCDRPVLGLAKVLEIP
ncbi:hypothetical protein [Nonomuraea sp. KM90]|uniref:hypothetical protein n=1 Tax=Nonomuraea sp. KM90 TaxID=3457428 RepID=UPI003FCECFCE